FLSSTNGQQRPRRPRIEWNTNSTYGPIQHGNVHKVRSIAKDAPLTRVPREGKWVYRRGQPFERLVVGPISRFLPVDVASPDVDQRDGVCGTVGDVCQLPRWSVVPDTFRPHDG